MNVETTSGVQISVKTAFQGAYDCYALRTFYFQYDITILNKNDFPIQLKKRYWKVEDEMNEPRIYTGSGVVGEEPILYPNDPFLYRSRIDTRTVLSSMSGYYTMLRLGEPYEFQVRIPRFELNLPFESN